MSDSLVLAVAQPPCVSYGIAVNAVAHADAVRAAGARVVVFPELSLTGYEFDAPAVAVDDPRLGPIVDACAQSGTLALVGAPVDDPDGRSYIAVLAIDGAGATVVYRKVHVHSSEAGRFSPGPDVPAVVEVDGWRLGLAVCRDTGIPGHAAALAAEGMDVYAAGILDHRRDAAVPPERARRIAGEHGVWVAFAGFAGSTGEGFDEALGRSGIWAPDGRVLAQAGPEVGGIARAALNRGGAVRTAEGPASGGADAGPA
ncbi:carbon-nitrogen hydrolase family protein [Streptacidiphilus jeojiense]|uniref:Carbon-nitrogen hydrolase family protein n=1 Tax=Streptacidiphilus cavernicola TaxID=3342716 RepID=A0ABV6UGV0_9ACTN|nr:carbon-nitrogen hydrolase family protein [Streptacidiphilus jeojiense]